MFLFFDCIKNVGRGEGMLQYQNLSDAELISKLDRSIKECKLFQLYLKDVNDDYGKVKVAKLKFEFARHEYLALMQEAQKRQLNVEEQKNMANVLFH